MSPSRRGFTLLEVVFVLVLIGAVSAALIPRLSGGRSVGTDRSAQGSADTALDAVISARTESGMITDDFHYLIPFAGDLTLTRNPSTTELTASVQRSGSVIGIAVLGAQTRCYYLRRDFGAAPGAQTSLYAFGPATTSQPCTGAYAAGLVKSTSQSRSGTSWADAQLVP